MLRPLFPSYSYFKHSPNYITLAIPAPTNIIKLHEFFQHMLGERPIVVKLTRGKVNISTQIGSHHTGKIVSISQLILALFENNIIHYEELFKYAPTMRSCVTPPDLATLNNMDEESDPVTGRILDTYLSFLRHFTKMHQPYIGLPINKLLYRYYGFPMSETIGCFAIDFDLWSTITSSNLHDFQVARDLFFDRDLSDGQYHRIYSIDGHDTSAEIGYFANLNKAFTAMCMMAKYKISPQLIDLINWHDIATEHLKTAGLRPESQANTVSFELVLSNSSREGCDELFFSGLVKRSRAEDRRSDYGCRFPYLHKNKDTEKYYILAGRMLSHKVLHIYINKQLAEIEAVFLGGTPEKDKLLRLIRFVKFFEVNHFFYDGNIRTCLLIFYYFIIRFRLPLTILSNPNIFDGFSINEIYLDVMKGRERYELLRQGDFLKLKELSKAF